MKSSKIEILIHFLLRIEMYIGKYEQYGVESFITGFEIGSNNEFHLTAKISTELENVYNIKYKAVGWTYQVKEYSNRLNIDWISGFTRLSFKVIQDAVTTEMKIEINQLIKNNISRKLTNWDTWFDKTWISKWVGICDLESNWFKKNWSQQELDFINRLNNEILLQIHTNDPLRTEKMIFLGEKLLTEINKNAS